MRIERVSHRIAVLAGCAGLAVTMTAGAQAPRSGDNASAQMMQQMQQLASERTTLQAENDKLKKQLADLTKDRDALKAGQQTVQRRAQETSAALAHSNSQREATDQQLAQLKAKMQELITKFRETLTKMRDIETENTAVKQNLAAGERRLSACVDRNAGLYQLNGEILTHMERKQGLFSCMASDEPFTKIKRVRLENLSDDYRARAQDLQVSPGVKPVAPTGAAPAAPAAAPATPAAPGATAPVAPPGLPAPQSTASPVPPPTGQTAN